MHDSKNAISVQNLLKDIAHTFAITSAKDDEAQTTRHGHDKTSESEINQREWLSTYHTAFHETMIREWAGIDSHRLNKALLTYRLVMRELFQICLSPLFKEASEETPEKPTNPPSQKKQKKQTSKKSAQPARPSATPAESQNSNALSATTSVVEVLKTAGPLNPSNRRIPDGLRLHLLDVWNDELFSALATLSEPNSSDNSDIELPAGPSRDGVCAVLELLKEPLEEMAKSDSGAQRHIRMRAKETLEVFDGKLGQVVVE